MTTATGCVRRAHRASRHSGDRSTSGAPWRLRRFQRGPGSPARRRPLASTSRWYFVPAMPRSVGFRPISSPHCRLDRDAVDAAARPVRHLRLGQLIEHELVQPVPHPGLLPSSQPPPRGVPGAVAQLPRQVTPMTAGVQHEQDARQRGPLIDPRPPSRPAGRRSRRKQRLDQLPQPIFDQPPLPRRRRHGRTRSSINNRRSRTDTPGFETRS